MNSVPTEIIQLGLGFDDYDRIAKNVKRVLDMQSAWGRILDRANSELSDEVSAIGTKLPLAMASDREFFEVAGLPYADGIPEQGCFTVAVADYLLRNGFGARV